MALANYLEFRIIRKDLMSSHASCESAGPLSKQGRVHASRDRSVPHRQSFVRAVLLSVAHYMGIVASATSLGVFFVNPTPLATKVFAASVAFTGATWLLAFFKRRHTHCPLCKGTPLINSGALAHQKAVRLFPFNHGVTATLSIIVNQKFRCMYCGTGFDLLKIPSHKRPPGENGYQGYYYNYTSDESSDS